MNTLNPLFAIFVFFIAYATAYVIKLTYKTDNSAMRYEGIDALRGFLALSVFIHHSCVWYQYLHTGKWSSVNSTFYNHLGQTSVSLFFMITSFLFISRLLNFNEGTFNWRAFFISRIFRLAPMYYLSLLIVTVFVLTMTHWQLNVGVFDFFKSIFHWALFTIFDMPMINGFTLTSAINAGVVRTLPYEWLFYLSLPLMSLFILKSKPSLTYILMGVVFIAIFFFVYGVSSHHILSFAGGAVAPVIRKYISPHINLDNLVVDATCIVCLFLVVRFETSTNLMCKVLISIVFTCIALGNTVFGLLKNQTFKFLGEISYSTYLLHGIILFAVLYVVIGTAKVKEFTPSRYCLVIFAITPVLVVISFLGYRVVEKPFMNLSKKINTGSDGV